MRRRGAAATDRNDLSHRGTGGEKMIGVVGWPVAGAQAGCDELGELLLSFF